MAHEPNVNFVIVVFSVGNGKNFDVEVTFVLKWIAPKITINAINKKHGINTIKPRKIYFDGNQPCFLYVLLLLLLDKGT